MAFDHAPCCRPCGQEVGSQIGGNREGEVLQRQINHRDAVNARLRNPDGVDGDINASRFSDHVVGMLFDRLLIESIHMSRFDLATESHNFLGDSVEGSSSPTSQKDSGSFTGKGSRNSATNGSSRSVDDGIFLLKQHRNPPQCVVICFSKMSAVLLLSRPFIHLEQTDRMNEVLITGQAHTDQSEYRLVIEPYRRELLLHCYRLLGSLHEAEDAVQDALVRAWRHFDTFTEKGSGSLRRWLYTIATNTSLDLLKKGSPRTLPTAASSAWDPMRPVAPRSAEVLWLEPFPDSWLAEATENPEARYMRSESVSLAFLTALQVLPPRQRAILILSDVLDWRASEIAQWLEISVGAVNSALQLLR
jgi:RNA polymerase sigma factor (sigma-70 family)